MKKIYSLLFFLFSLSYAYSQTYVMSAANNGTTQVTCKGVIYNTVCTYGPPGPTFQAYCQGLDRWQAFSNGGGGPIRINLTYLSLNTGDFVRIYQGVGTGGTLLASFTNTLTTMGNFVTSTTGIITVRFTTDSDGAVGDGFEAIIGCQPTGCNGNNPAGDSCTTATRICDISPYCGNTGGWYTDGKEGIDGPDGSGLFCGSIENNSWIVFTANTSSPSFQVNVAACTSTASGIQMQMLSSTNCSTFTSVSACISQSTAATAFTLTPNVALTVGTSYYLMVDGYAGNFCSYTVTPLVGVQVPTVTIPSPTICTGQTTTITLNGSTAGSTFSWTAPSNGAILSSTTNSYVVISPTSSVVYSVTVSQPNGCASDTYTQTVTVNSNPTVAVSNATTCSASPTILTASGASTYSWSTGATTPTISTSTAGTYTVRGTTNGCSNTQTVSLTVSANPTVAVSNATICAGTPTTITASGATTYSWSTGATTSTISTSTAGVYTVTGTTNGCSNTQTINVTVTANPTVAVANATICAGSSTVLTASGATTYSWNTGAITSTLSVSSAGVYTVTGTSNGCTNTKTVSLSVTANPTVAVSNATTCAGTPTTITASGATTYSWSTGATTSTISTSTAGVYTVTGTTNGCSNTQTINVTVTANPAVAVANATICAGSSTVLTASGATTYSWNTGATTSTLSVSSAGVYTVTGTSNGCTNTKTVSLAVTANPTVAVSNATTCAGTPTTITASGATTYSWSTGATTSTISTSTAGVYTVTGTTNGCSNTQTVNLTVTANPTVAVANATICAGSSTVLTASGATTYSWNTGATTSTVSVSSAGVYTVTGTTNGCANTKTVSLTVNSIPTTTASTTGTLTCTNLSVDLNATLAGASYTWSAPSGGSVASANSQTTTVSGAPGTYSLFVQSASGCTYSTTTSVTQNTTAPSGFSAGANQTLTCVSPSVTLTGVVGVPANAILNWSGANVCGSSTTIATSACGAGVYTLTATNPVNGCIQTSTVNVAPSAGSPSVTVTSTSQTITCTNTVAVLSVTTSASPVTYTWSGTGITSGVNSNSISVTQGGTYVYTVEASNGCKTSNNIVVLQNTIAPSVVSSSTGSLNCLTTTVNASATTSTTPVSYTWSGAGITAGSNTGTITVNQGGTYNYTVTNTDNNCVTSGSLTIVQDVTAPSVVSSSTGSLNCLTTTVNASATTSTNPVSYAWSGAGITAGSGTGTITVNLGGTYDYTVTNTDNNCVTTGSVAIAQDITAPSVVSSSTGSLNCLTTTVNASATTSTTPASYTWSGAGITAGSGTGTITVNLGGTYDYTVTNTDNNCVTTGSVAIAQDITAPSVVSSSTGSLNCLTTTVNASASTTVTPASYVWSGAGITAGSGTGTITVNQGGTYDYTVTNTDNGCAFSGSVAVTQDVNTPTVTVSGTQTITCASPTVTLIGSVTPSTCIPVWTGGVTSGANSYTATTTSANVFTLTVTDPTNLCTSTATTEVVADAGFPSVTASASGSLSCLAGTVNVVATTTSSPVSYSWSGPGIIGTNASTATVNQGGLYTVTVTNTSSSCESVVTVSVTQNTAIPTVVVSPSQTLTCAVPTLAVSSTVTPSGSYTYTWTGAGILSGTNTDVITVNASSNYVLEVTDAVNGCTNTATAVVNSDANLPSASILATSTNTVITCNNTSVNLLADVTPVASVYSYTWTTGANTPTISVNSASVVGVVVTNIVTGCSTAATITISNNTVVPSVSTSNSIIPCGTSSISLTSTASNVNYNWTTTNGNILSGANSASPSISSAGVYVLTVTDITNGCVNTATSNVTQTNINVAFTANPTSGTAPLIVTFSDQSSGVANYSWNFGDNNNNTSTSASPVHTYTTPGVYVVSLTGTDAALACSNTVTLTIEVLENTTIIIPNVFTPNGDGANDKFKIVTTGMKELTVDIFNRWGAKLYTISSPSDSWDGSGASDGTYFFILKAIGYDGKDYNKEGYINLFR